MKLTKSLVSKLKLVLYAACQFHSVSLIGSLFQTLPQLLLSFQTFHTSTSTDTADVLPSHIIEEIHLNTWVLSQIARLPPLAEAFLCSPVLQWKKCASSQPSIHFSAAHLTGWLSIIQCTPPLLLLLFFFLYLFIWLRWVLVAACGIFLATCSVFRCSGLSNCSSWA